jgi:uncharacterized protein
MPLVDDTSISSTRNNVGEIREYINELFASPACPKYTMNIDQLDGYLRAIAAEPRPTQPKDWMPLIFGGEFPCFISGHSTDIITNALICLYNSHRAQVLNNQCVLPFRCEFSAEKSMRIQAEQWARGFMQGYIFWQDIWSRFLDENQTSSNLAVILPIATNDEIDDILATVSAVADADYALQTGVTIDELTLLFNQLSQKVIVYGRIAHIIRSNGDLETCERVKTEH